MLGTSSKAWSAIRNEICLPSVSNPICLSDPLTCINSFEFFLQVYSVQQWHFLLSFTKACPMLVTPRLTAITSIWYDRDIRWLVTRFPLNNFDRWIGCTLLPYYMSIKKIENEKAAVIFRFLPSFAHFSTTINYAKRKKRFLWQHKMIKTFRAAFRP